MIREERLDEVADRAKRNAEDRMLDLLMPPQPGESETITFVAGEAGRYSLVCLVPAHAVSGMWIGFEVSPELEPGVLIST